MTRRGDGVKFRLEFRRAPPHRHEITRRNARVSFARASTGVTTVGFRISHHITLYRQLDRRSVVYVSRVSALDAEKTSIPDDS